MSKNTLPFYLKIVDEKRTGPIRKCDGYSRKRYVFKWSQKDGAYVYDPASQKEVDDLFKNKGTWLRYSPVARPAPKVAPPAPVEEVKPAAVEPPAPPKEPLNDALVENCLRRGVVVTEDDTDLIARRLIDAYDKGATDTLAAVPGRNKNAGAKSAKPTAPAGPPA